MTIDKVRFGKNLRPSTVDVMNKINEIVDSVNSLETNSGTADISALKTNVQTLQTQVGNVNTEITNLKSKDSTFQTDIDKIKRTLYTPLAAEDTTE